MQFLNLILQFIISNQAIAFNIMQKSIYFLMPYATYFGLAICNFYKIYDDTMNYN